MSFLTQTFYLITLSVCTISASAASSPLKALLIAGGCCHDYAEQHKILSHGLQQRANMRVDVIWSANESAAPKFDLFEDPLWADGYDLIIHDECAAANSDEKTISNIVNAHKTIPAVHLHCAMHSYRRDEWRKQVGLLSMRHGPHVPIEIEITEKDHPIMRPLKNWVSTKDELYHVIEVYDAEPLALGTQRYIKDGKEAVDTAIVAWTNTKHGAPSFSTSLGHFNEVVMSEEYMTLVTRGALWACGKLDHPEYHTPYDGENTITEIPTQNLPETVKLSASSSQTSHGHLIDNIIDSDPTTRWCAATGDFPASIELEFSTPTNLLGLELHWEFPDQWMQYKIECSKGNNVWKTVSDMSTSGRTGLFLTRLNNAHRISKLRVVMLAQQHKNWPSIREVKIIHANGDVIPICK